MSIPNTNSISSRFSMVMVLLVSIIILLFGALLTLDTVRKLEQELSYRMCLALNLAVSTLGSPIWDLNFLNLEDFTEALLQDEAIVYVAILDSVDMQPLAQKTRTELAHRDWDFFTRSSQFLTRTTEIQYAEQTVGLIQIAAFRGSIQQEIVQRSLSIFALILILILTISVVSLVLSKRVIERPLNRLIDHTRQLADGKLDIDIDTRGKTEISRLARDFLHMRNAIRHKIHELEQTRQSLTAERNLLRTFIDNMPDYIYVKDRQSRFLLANPALIRLMGVRTLEDLLGKTDFDFYPDDLAQKYYTDEQQIITSGTPLLHREEPFIHPQTGLQRWLLTTKAPFYDSQGNIAGIVGIGRDITERKRLEEMMVQTEKLMSVGGLAAGMAHEINNPLSGILQSAQNLLRRTSPELEQNVRIARECGTDLESIRAYLEKRGIFAFIENIRDAGQRAATIMSDMLCFSRRSETEKVPVNVAAMLDKTIALASTDYDLKKKYDFRNIVIKREYDPDLPDVPCVETEIIQVLLNLLRNAAQAMAEQADRSGPSTIIMRSRREEQKARIEVEDNGPGMSDLLQKRIFEPFFTTKDVGAGTGLGLSVSFFIIASNHQGTLEVESAEGKGTKFTISLPLEL